VLVARRRRHVVAEPVRESGWRLLAMALYLSGNPAAALATIGDAHDVLVEQLGVGPGAALRDLRDAILSGADAAVRAQLHAGPGRDESAAPDRVRALVAQLADELGLLRAPTDLLVGRKDAARPAR
jgi:DNA-binding SARP family transcriptional activator